MVLRQASVLVIAGIAAGMALAITVTGWRTTTRVEAADSVSVREMKVPPMQRMLHGARQCVVEPSESSNASSTHDDDLVMSLVSWRSRDRSKNARAGEFAARQ